MLYFIFGAFELMNKKFCATNADTLPTKVKLGFTLAEILITLGVIGVVAAMTIPTLMSAYNRHVVETRLYKIHSTFMQGIRMAQANSDSNFTVQNPTTGKEDVNGFSWENSKLVFDEYFAPVFKISHTYPKGTRFKVYSTDGQAQVDGAGDGNTYQIALLDGTVLGFTKFGGPNTRFYLDITINPTRKKLISGRDTFLFNIQMMEKEIFKFTTHIPLLATKGSKNIVPLIRTDLLFQFIHLLFVQL